MTKENEDKPVDISAAAVKAAVDGLQKSFHDFKLENDKLVDQGKKADAVTEQNIQNINGKIDEFNKKLEDIAVAMKRVPLQTAGAVAGMVAPEITAEQADYQKAWDNVMRTTAGKNDHDSVKHLKEMAQKAMIAGSDIDGGYTVPVIVNNRIVKRQYETTPMRTIASVMTISSDSVMMPVDLDEAGAVWVAETQEPGETTTPTLRNLRIPVWKLAAEPHITEDLLEDSAWDLESWLADKVADKFSRTENAAFITGNGVGKPRGLLSYASAADSGTGVTWGQIGHVATGASGAFNSTNPADAMIQLVGTLKTAYLQGATWLMGRITQSSIRRFKDTTGQYLWQPSLQLGQPNTFLGYGVTAAEDMPAIAAGSLSIAFGNFRSAYQIVDRRGIRVLNDPYTRKPYVKFYTTKRVGGDVVNFEAFKVLKFS